MSIESLTATARDEGARRRANPEGLTVKVLTTDETTARLLGPRVAAAVYPERRLGALLLVELDPVDGHWLTTVQDFGPVFRTTQGARPPA